MKTKVKIKSILEQLTPMLNATKSIEEIKSIVSERLDKSRIKDKDLILDNLSAIKSHQRALFYVYNSLLAYEGLRVK